MSENRADETTSSKDLLHPRARQSHSAHHGKARFQRDVSPIAQQRLQVQAGLGLNFVGSQCPRIPFDAIKDGASYSLLLMLWLVSRTRDPATPHLNRRCANWPRRAVHHPPQRLPKNVFGSIGRPNLFRQTPPKLPVVRGCSARRASCFPDTGSRSLQCARRGVGEARAHSRPRATMGSSLAASLAG